MAMTYGSKTGRKDPANETAGRVERAITPRRKVLIVDDSRMQRHILTLQLTRAGYDVRAAASGLDAIELCVEDMPDIVLSDWMMPVMDGLQFCKAYRALPRESHGYFILLTSLAEKDDAARGLETGADDYLTKPISREELLARLKAAERLISVEERLQERNRALDQALGQLRSAHESLERDLVEARRLQQGLVRDRFRRFGRADVSLLLHPAGHVGGDLVGCFPINQRRIGVYGIDVSGHGVTAALVTARLAGYLSSSLAEGNIALFHDDTGAPDARSPAELAQYLNEVVIEEMETDCYLTLVYADLDVLSGEVRIVQAGHPHPVLQRAGGEVCLLGEGGLPIGLLEGARYEEFSLSLQSGDRLLLTSDGMTEAADRAGRLLGEEGLLDIMCLNRPLRGAAMLESLTWSVCQFAGGERADDISAVLVEFNENPVETDDPS